MNKIIIVGHPQSGYEEVERLLVECGMAPALPSRREKLTPDQISRTLVKAHGATPIESLQSPRQLQQITVAPVWQGMALDLMLANVEQPLWGWADTQAAYLLDYWKSQDPQIVFVLVYDEPQTVYTRLSLEQASAPEVEQQRRIDAWVSYNAALLHFHLRNPERSLLVHARQVQVSVQSYLQQISARIDAPLHVPPALMSEIQGAAQEDEPQNSDVAVLGHQSVHGSLMHFGPAHLAKAKADDLQTSALADLLASQLVGTNPEAQQLYDELQAAATLPHGFAARSSGQQHLALSASDSAKSRYLAWQALITQQVALQERTEQIRTLSLQFDHAKGLVQESKAEMEKLTQAKTTAEKQAQEHARQAEALQEEWQTAHEQVKQLQTQLHAAQACPAPSADLQQENELLLSQLHQVQEELERLYLENRKLKAPASLKPQPVARAGAAKRIKQELPYRLGALMIAQSRSLGGWLGMPFALRAETRRYQQEQQSAAGQPPLPPISEYRDAHEAEKIKQHLSYRLGRVLLESNEKPLGWLGLPWALSREVRHFRQQRSSR